MDPFNDLAGIWKVIKEREIQLAGVLQLNLNEMEVDGLSVMRHHEELNAFLGEAAEGIQSGDCIMLGDLLEYELAPRAELESRIVADLKQHARKMFG